MWSEGHVATAQHAIWQYAPQQCCRRCEGQAADPDKGFIGRTAGNAILVIVRSVRVRTCATGQAGQCLCSMHIDDFDCQVSPAVGGQAWQMHTIRLATSILRRSLETKQPHSMHY